MKKINRIAIGVLALSLLATGAFAGQKHKPKAPVCPACKMTLSTKKDKMHTVAVKIKGKTYYCCAMCNMNAKPKSKKK